MAITNTHTIIALANIKEEEVKAYFDYNYNKMGEEYERLVQEMTSSYALLVAESFLGKHEKFFSQEENRGKIRYHISAIGADKPHSGYRFWEALSQAMKNQEKSSSDEKDSETDEIQNN